MPSTRLFRSIGGLAGIGSGFLLASAHVINLLSGVEEWDGSRQKLCSYCSPWSCFCFYRFI